MSGANTAASAIAATIEAPMIAPGVRRSRLRIT